MSILSAQFNFTNLSLKDLLAARDAYHWHLMNKANVVGTAVSLYLERKHGIAHSTPRTFANSEVTKQSWPCILVLVNDWVHSTGFGGASGIDPTHMVPKTLYLVDGRAAPVCIVLVEQGTPAQAAPADARWPASYIGGGCPILASVQGAEHRASVGCLVSDGHKTYALTNRHVAGEPGTVISGLLRGNTVEVGVAADKSLSRIPFTDVFPEFSVQRTYLTLDVGLIDVDVAADWTSQPFGLEGTLGGVADLNEANLGTQLIDFPVEAFGAVSGHLKGRIKALFYRHKAMAGYDYVSEFLIAPDNGQAQTCPGDSGTVWYLVDSENDAARPVAKRLKTAGRKQPSVVGQPVEAIRVLRPIAVEWGGQGFVDEANQTLNFSLATGLSTVCELLDMDLVRSQDIGAIPFWGQVGHYSIAAAAIDLVQGKSLQKLLIANLTNISFVPGALSANQIREALSKGDFVELADVPDLVWKKVGKDVPGGRDYAKNAGPEHPNHYADVDKPDDKGVTMREAVLDGSLDLDPQAWIAAYKARGESDPRHLGLLPFRVWQLFDVMVAALKAGRISTFLCAAGVISHYIGDACQPLHGSYLSNGYQDHPVASTGKSKKWQGMGVHSAYEDKMVDANSKALLGMIGPAAKKIKTKLTIATGKDAALATVKLMDACAEVIAPSELCDTYIKLGGGTSKAVIAGLWDAFGDRTGTVMGQGAYYLAAIWDAAFVAAKKPILKPTAFRPADLAKIYQNEKFAPSLTIDKIGAVLK